MESKWIINRRAEALPEMYETLLYALHLQDYIQGKCGTPQDMPELVLKSVQQALAKAGIK